MTSYSVCKHNKHRERIDAVKSRRKFWLFGPLVETVTSYIGSGTVWHDEVTGKRCDGMLETELFKAWSEWKNERYSLEQNQSQN